MKKTNDKGVALLVVMFAILIMTFLAVEIGYNTTVEMKVGAAQVDRLKAFYLAKSGVQLSLLRINVYKVAMQRFGAQLGASKSDLDLIWQFPFAWPPALPKESSDFDKEQVKSAVAKSYIDGAFSTTIEGESGKIDLNDLGSPAEALKTAASVQLINILQNRMSVDDDWARDHRDLRPKEIINNIADWVSAGETSLNGGSKTQYYNSTNPRITPAMRPMKTIEELHMVAGITDEIYDLLAPKVTVYGIKGINLNYASGEVIRSIDPLITADVAKAIIERRTDPTKGPFKDVADFTTFLGTQGIRTDNFNKNPVIPLLFDAEYNFRIKSTGIYGHAQREIIAIVYDFDKVKSQLSTILAQASASPGATPTPTPANGAQQPGATPSPTPTTASQTSSGPPQVIYWQEL